MSTSQASTTPVSPPLIDLNFASDPKLAGLTASQRIFRLYTGLNPKMCAVPSGAPFFLWMRMRKEEQWAVHNMTPRKCVEATTRFNDAMKNDKQVPQNTSPITPQAFMEKLVEVESTVISRIGKNCFACKCYSRTRRTSI